MGKISRRDFLAAAAVLGAEAAWGRSFSTPSKISWRRRRDLFPEGVASGASWRALHRACASSRRTRDVRPYPGINPQARRTCSPFACYRPTFQPWIQIRISQPRRHLADEATVRAFAMSLCNRRRADT